MTRAHKREVDRDALHESWQRQASELGFDPRGLVDEARHWQAAHEDLAPTHAGQGMEAETGMTAEADRAAAWAVAHLSETRRQHMTMRGKSGGAAAERGAAGDARREDGRWR